MWTERDAFGRLMSAIRAAGIVAVFLMAFTGSDTEPAFAGMVDECEEYILQDCMDPSVCESLADEPCGEEAGPQCAGEGWKACGFEHPEANCDASEVTMICQFEQH